MVTALSPRPQSGPGMPGPYGGRNGPSCARRWSFSISECAGIRSARNFTVELRISCVSGHGLSRAAEA